MSKVADKWMSEILGLHQELALRPNASTQTVQGMAQLGKSFMDSVAVGVQTLGGFHAPIVQTAKLWLMSYPDFKADIIRRIDAGEKVPGFGSSFIKDGPDPVFDKLDVPEAYMYRLEERRALVSKYLGVDLWPNAAAYTAIYADMLCIKPELAPKLVLQGRMDAWAHAWDQAYVGTIS